MKVLVLFLCGVASAAAGETVAWPGAIPITASQLKTITPGQIKGFAYSTSQYINAIPSAAFGYQPQFSYQISIPGYHPAQPITGASYYPAPVAPFAPASPILPAAPVAPIQPPFQNIPSGPVEQPAGDEDSAVIESADSLNQQSSQFPLQSSQPSLDTKNMPGFPQVPQESPQIPPFPQWPQSPQIPLFPPFSQFPQQNPSAQFPLGSHQIPSAPQLPLGSHQVPSAPQFPLGSQKNPSAPQFILGSQQNLPTPQFPQVSPVIPLFPQNSQEPSFPQFPQVPQQIPSFPPIPQYQQPGLIPQQPLPPASASFPSADNSDKGLNNEDTISVESA